MVLLVVLVEPFVSFFNVIIIILIRVCVMIQSPCKTLLRKPQLFRLKVQIPAVVETFFDCR